MKTNARVVIVGRTNVGKSTLFNRLSERVKSIVYDQPGVTRDFIQDYVSWQGRTFSLIDTGGIPLTKVTDPLLKLVRDQALEQIDHADIVLFMCDGSVGVLPEDREIARILYRRNKKVLLLINKMDNPATTDHIYEFERLGFPDLFFISALHGKAIEDLLIRVVSLLPEQDFVEEKKSGYRVVILGKPNVGKSSLMNILLQSERSIVSDAPGTTREPIIGNVTFYQEDVQITDTAGIRRKRKVDEALEQIMVKTSFKALDRADIVLLMIDASAHTLSDQEIKLLYYAFEQTHKAVIVLLNKQDLVTDHEDQMVSLGIEAYDYLFDKLVMLSISCKTGKNIGKILPMIQKVWQRHSQRFSDDELTFVLQQALIRRPLYRNETRLQVVRAKQIRTAPITIMITAIPMKFFEKSQLAFLEKALRKEYDLQGVPISFVVRGPKKGNN